MNEFSIDLASEQIVDRRTRENFQEVLSSFIAGNTRSAVVMLWTVIVCDLVYKLQDLRDADSDKIATQLLEDVAKEQLKAPKNTAWEAALLESVWKRTLLLDNAEYMQLQQIQQLRHLSAHPALGSTNLLYRPNRETTRACIRNALESLLLKPALFTKGIVDSMVLDLEAKRDLLPSDVSLQRYLEARFLAAGTPSAIENAMFQRLWTLAFRVVDDPRADANRAINVRALSVLYRRRKAALRTFVESNAITFSSVGTGEPLEELVRFLGGHPGLYEPLTAAAKEPVRQVAEADVRLFAWAWYLSSDAASHISKVTALLREGHEYAVMSKKASPTLSEGTWANFIESASESGVRLDALRVGIEHYARSRSFDQADARFETFVKAYIDDYDEASIRALLEGVEKNNQAWARNRARVDHLPAYERAVTLLGKEHVHEQFPDFISGLQLK